MNNFPVELLWLIQSHVGEFGALAQAPGLFEQMFPSMPQPSNAYERWLKFKLAFSLVQQLNKERRTLEQIAESVVKYIENKLANKTDEHDLSVFARRGPAFDEHGYDDHDYDDHYLHDASTVSESPYPTDGFQPNERILFVKWVTELLQGDDLDNAEGFVIALMQNGFTTEIPDWLQNAEADGEKGWHWSSQAHEDTYGDSLAVFTPPYHGGRGRGVGSRPRPASKEFEHLMDMYEEFRPAELFVKKQEIGARLLAALYHETYILVPLPQHPRVCCLCKCFVESINHHRQTVAVRSTEYDLLFAQDQVFVQDNTSLGGSMHRKPPGVTMHDLKNLDAIDMRDIYIKVTGSTDQDATNNGVEWKQKLFRQADKELAENVLPMFPTDPNSNWWTMDVDPSLSIESATRAQSWGRKFLSLVSQP